MAKPRGTQVPLARYLAALDEAGEHEKLASLVLLTEVLAKARDAGEISDLELALIDLEQYTRALDAGEISVAELNYIMEKRNTELESVRVPVWYVREIVAAFQKYVSRNGEITFGEAFGLEGGGQGKRKRVQTLRIFMREVQLCDGVEWILAEREMKGEPISLEEAFATVAEISTVGGEKISSDIVRRAYRKRGKTLRDLFLETWGV